MGTDSRQRFARVGCLAFALPVFVALAPLIFVWTWLEDYRSAALLRQFRRRFGPDKIGILVYSNSPHWQKYVETAWLPRIEHRFVILNWSERARWKDLAPFEAGIFRRFSGPQEFNPLAIILLDQPAHATWSAWLAAIRAADAFGMLVPSVPRVQTIRFWQAFRDFKHGREHALRRAEAALFSAAGVV
jgi:hypothetical protein